MPPAHDGRGYRILGSLGSGPFAALLAEEVAAWGLRRRVVLHRPDPSGLSARFGLLGSPRLVAEEGRLEVEGSTFAVSGWAAGIDAGRLLDRHPDGLPARVAVALAAGVAAALIDARRAALDEGRPAGHGALDGGAVRLDVTGLVRVVRFRGGDEANDVATLGDLLEAWAGDAAPPDLRELAETMGGPEAPALDAVHQRLVALEPDLPGPALEAFAAEEVPHGPVPVAPHPLQGHEIPVGGAEAAPARVRVAGPAAMTLLLGVGIGLVLGGAFGEPAPASGPAEITVRGAERIEVECEGRRLSTTDETLAVPAPGARCVLRAILPDDARSERELDVAPAGRYLCRIQEGELTCAER